MAKAGKVKLITGLLLSNIEEYPAIRHSLVRMFGNIDFESEFLDFTHTSYYDSEMGPGLKRKFLGFEKLRDLKNIYTAKLGTGRLESRYARGGKRTVNIDPGYIDFSKLVLFSTKDYTHRLHLGRGIYGEATLFYKDNKFNPWPWTYPDYKSSEYLDIFESIRRSYKEKVKSV